MPINHTESANSGLTWFARVGMGAKAVVYATLGILALQAAFGGGSASGQQGVAQQLGAIGQVLLWATAIGLMLYALWRAAQALGISRAQTDADDKKETAQRLGAAGSAIANMGLAVLFALIALGVAGGGSGGWTGLLDSTWGRVVVGIVGLLFLSAAVGQFVVAARESYMESIGIDDSQMRTVVRRLGQAAYGARGVVFAMVGCGLIVSAWRANKAEYTSMAGALNQLAEQSYGQFLLAAVALGLLAYGVVAAILSRYVSAHRA
jgi:hypothetical protein